MAQGIVVLGMHRSGTSLIASLINRWGAYAGDHGLIAADKWNPRGYWEYLPLVMFNMRLLREVDSRTYIPPDREQAARLVHLSTVPTWRAEGLAVLKEMKSVHDPWLWKDPRLSVLLPFWQAVWGKVVYVIAVRNPHEIVESLRRREERLPVASALVVWQRYATEVLRRTSESRKIFVSYNHLMDDATGQCRRLCAFLDREVGRRPDRRARDASQAMAQAVDAALYRNRHRPPRDQRQDATTVGQRRLYQLLLRAATRDQIDDGRDLAIQPEAGWRELLRETASMCIDFVDQRPAGS